jgi:PEP-CTERM motif
MGEFHTTSLILRGHAPGSTLGGSTDFFVEGGFVQIGGTSFELTPVSVGSVFMTSFTLPTNGKYVVTVPVVVGFEALMASVDTGQIFALSGGNSGTITFYLNNGFYLPSGFVNAAIPEPGTLGLMGTGLISILALARKRLRRVPHP